MQLKNAECSPGTADIHANCSGVIPKNVAQNAAEKCGGQPWICGYIFQLLRFYFEKCGPKCGLKNAERSPGTADIHPYCSGLILKNAAEKYRVQPWNC